MQILLALLLCTTPAMAYPLQGYIEQSDTATETRINLPHIDTLPPIAPHITVDKSIDSSIHSGIVHSDDFASVQHNEYAYVNQSSIVRFIPIQQHPQSDHLNKAPIEGNTYGGQNEYWINWDAWRHRIADAVWRPIIMQGIRMYGQTRVDYDVKRDHHVHITNIYTPDPSGVSGRILANSIMQLDGDPIFEFPSGSQQMVHHNWNKDLGLPFLSRLGQTIYLPGGIEHVVNRW